MVRSLALNILVGVCMGSAAAPCSAAKLSDVEHIIVIYLENRSFDNLFGLFPGADGIAAAGASKIQVDKDGRPYAFLARAMEQVDHQLRVDSRFPDNLPNQPFSIEAY